MKFLLVFSACILVAATSKNCSNKKEQLPEGCYKGRLEIKGGCMNYTISMVSGTYDSAMVVKEWTDDHSGKSYKNVFALGSRCNFPSTIQEGDEFYFKIDNTTKQDCAVCMMYYPVPPKQISIKVLDQPCTEKSE